MDSSQYIINNSWLSSKHDTTNIYVGVGKGERGENGCYSFDKPIYRLPVHLLLNCYLTYWRNNSSLPLSVRRIATGAALGTLAILGVIDAVARFACAILIIPIKRSVGPSKLILQDASYGLSGSLHLLTCSMKSNYHQEVKKF